MVSLDSRSAPIAASQELEIRKAPFTIKLVRRDGFDFLDTIREKLMWGTDKRN
jgi:NAD+ kinase